MKAITLGQNMREVILIQDGAPVTGLLIDSFASGQREDGKWEGAIVLTRSSGELEKMVARDPVFWIMIAVREADGSETRYFYTEAHLSFRNAGSWKRDAFVSQTIAFVCDTRSVGT